MPRYARLRRSVGLVIGHADCRRPERARVSARRSAPGSRCRLAMCRTRSAASAAGIPAAVMTGTAWVAVRGLHLAAPITGMPNSACACAPSPDRPSGVPATISQAQHSAQIIQDRAQRRDLAQVELTQSAGRYRLEIFAMPRPERPTTPASNGNPADVIYRQDLTTMPTCSALGRCRALPGFGHPVACPAPGGLAELPGQLALGQGPARLEAGAVGGHRGGVDVAVRADGRHRPR